MRYTLVMVFIFNLYLYLDFVKNHTDRSSMHVPLQLSRYVLETKFNGPKRVSIIKL